MCPKAEYHQSYVCVSVFYWRNIRKTDEGLSPPPLVLLQQDKHTCGATQTITNQAEQAVGWSWEPLAVDGCTVQVNRGTEVTWPSNWLSSIAPGGADTLQVRSDCKHQSITVHLTDTLGHRYSFALTVR
jgi:hypothetical protein